MLEERTILVTGPNGGIGRAIVESLLSRHARVVGISRRALALPAHERYLGIAFDFQRTENIAGLVGRVLSEVEQVNGLVHCAGIGRFGGLESFSTEQMEQVLGVNLLAPMSLTRSLLPHLKSQTHADVVFIGSEAALQGARQGTVYCASKFGIRGFSQALRQECSRSSVRVTCVNPGMVRTGFFDALHFEPGADDRHAVQPEDVAEAVTMALLLRPGTVVDEINLGPHQNVIHKKGSTSP